jgi:hypothetical protein
MAAVNVRAPARKAERRKKIGLALAGVPVAVVGFFAVGEGIGGEAGWWGHLIQFTLLLVVVAAAWHRPRIGGPALVLLGAGLVGMVVGRDEDLAAQLSTIAILSTPLIVSGVLFTFAGYSRNGAPTPATNEGDTRHLDDS